MDISAISSISGIDSISSIADSTSSTVGESSFTDILSEAITNAQDAEGASEEANADLLTGETDDLHTPLIEAQKAELALDLAIQIRNKVINAYNTVMNMQV